MQIKDKYILCEVHLERGFLEPFSGVLQHVAYTCIKANRQTWSAIKHLRVKMMLYNVFEIL